MAAAADGGMAAFPGSSYGSFRHRMNAGCADKTVRSLENARHIPERLRDVFTTRRYANPRLHLPFPYHAYDGRCDEKRQLQLVDVSYIDSSEWNVMAN